MSDWLNELEAEQEEEEEKEGGQFEFIDFDISFIEGNFDLISETYHYQEEGIIFKSRLISMECLLSNWIFGRKSGKYWWLNWVDVAIRT